MNEIPAQPDNYNEEIEELVDTKPERPLKEVNIADGQAGELQYHAALRSHIGVVRERNEDSCLIYSSDSSGHFPLLPFELYLVADGMGGYDGGDHASKIASRTAAHHLIQQIYMPLLSSQPPHNQAAVEEIMHEAVLTAHQAVQQAECSGNGGTTLTIALVLGQQLYLAHVGDSRAYWLVNGDLQALTRDHSLVQRLQDAGKLTTEEAQNYQFRNVLLRALGQEEDLDVDTYIYALPPGGKLLLCSDGLCGQIPDEQIQQIMYQTQSPDQIADQLVEAALEAGGLDNISAIVAEFTP